MKKELRKEWEKKVAAAISGILPNEQKVAISKSNKAIKEASELVVKKFAKAMKAIEKEKKRLQKKVSVVKKKKKKAAVAVKRKR